MKRPTPLAAIALAALLVAGCSSGTDEADSMTADETTTSAPSASTTSAEVTTTTAAESTSDLPSYDTAKEVYLAQTDDTTKASCSKDAEDKEIQVASGTYLRFTCGDFGRFEYIEGEENYTENWPTISSTEQYRSVFHVPGKLIVVPAGANDDFAPALAEACDCGEVVVQTG